MASRRAFFLLSGSALLAPAIGYAQTPAPPVEAAGWQGLAGPWFEGLLDEALQGSPTIGEALARQRAAELATRERVAVLLPRATASLGQTTSRASDSNGGQTSRDANASLGVSWTLDLWGKARDELRAARLEAEAVAFDADGARLALALQTAQAAAAAFRTRTLASANQTVIARTRQITTIVEASNQLGSASAIDPSEARAALELALVSGVEAQQAFQAAGAGLAATLGRDPLEGTVPEGVLVIVPEPPRQPTTLADLATRPDLRAIDIRLEAAGVNVSLARRALYPDLSLSAVLTAGARGFNGLLASRNLADQLTGALSATLFDGGASRARIRVARQEVERLATVQRVAMLRAAEEVVRAEAGLASLEEGLPLRQSALAARREATRLARVRHQAGTISTLELLRAEAALQQEEDAFAILPADWLTAKATFLSAKGMAPSLGREGRA